VAHRTFTLEEANAALAELRPVAERMVDLRRHHRGALEKRDELRARIGSNGGGLSATDVAAVEAEVEQLGDALAACIDRLHKAGVQVKDVDAGLLDFPSLRRGVEVLLCWRVGEESIAFWHGADEGFAGRKPLDAVE
jgi:hypothetical protein